MGIVVPQLGPVLPEWVARNERRRRAMELAEHINAEVRYWNPRLRDIDQDLYLTRVKPRVIGPGLFPDMWHVIREPPGFPFTAWVISTNGLGVPGPYREMGEDILEILRRGDMWDKQRLYENQRAAERREASKQRAKENHKEARVDDLALNIKAMTSPGVLFGEKGWTQSKRGRRGRST